MLKGARNMAQNDQSRSEIYHLIYSAKEISKQEIAKKCGLSLPTLSKYLKQLLDEGLIQKNGIFSSTGGRPAVIYSCNKNAGIAVGVEITADQVNIAAVNLCGEIPVHKEYRIPFKGEADYYENISSKINSFIHDLDDKEKNLIGVTLAIQGIVSSDKKSVLFCGLLDNAVIRKDMFEPYLDYPFSLVHDAEAASYAELWLHADLSNALYLSLNRYLGSAMILSGRLAESTELGAGIAEHMIMVPGGRECYCGSRGCADTLLSINALEEEAGCSVEQMFTNIHYGDPHAKAVLDSYLHHLAALIYNVMMIAQGDVIIGGYLENFLQDEHYRRLEKEIHRYRLLENAKIRLIPGYYAHHAAVIGAGLMRIRDFLETI